MNTAVQIEQMLGESRFVVNSRSRGNVAHIVSFHRTDLADHIEERCTCEHFLMGIPRRIKNKDIDDTPENRRCWHIRQVNMMLAHEAQKALVASDASQAEGCQLPQDGLAPARKATA